VFKDEIDDGYHAQLRSEETQIRALRLAALARVYQGADRILTGDPLVVNVVKEGPAPAWSDGASITINAALINDIDLDTIAQINGLNYHELAHHLYTPRKGTPLVQWVIEKNYFMAFNALEDQRIDSLLCARYPSIIPFLEATVLRFLAETPQEAVGNYIVVRGRRYLPVEIRQGFRDIFYKPELIPAIIEIVDEYRLLTFPKDYKRAEELIERFQLEVLDNVDMPLSGGISQCGHRAPIAKGRPEPGKLQERDAKRAQGMGTKEAPFKPKSKEQIKAEKEVMDKVDVMSVGGNTNTNNTDPNEDHTAPETVAEALERRENSVANSTPTVGKGHSDSLGGIPDSLMDDLETALDNVINRSDVQADIQRKQRIIIYGDDKHEDTGKRGKFDKAMVPSTSMIAYRKFAHELQKLRDDAEPFWQRETQSGRLNTQRVIRGCELDVAFDRWTEQDDSTDIEAIICIDRSGSMSSNQNDRKASIACWTIKRAFEHIGCPVTVYAFDDKNEIAYTKDEKADKTQFKFIYGDGGTNPYESLLLAEKTFLASKASNKMLFIITDGAFNTDKNDDIIKRIAKRGVLTSMVLIMRKQEYENAIESNKNAVASGYSHRWEFRHGAEIFGTIDNAAELAPFARSVVVGAIKKRGRR
jgi:hypothetical protein